MIELKSTLNLLNCTLLLHNAPLVRAFSPFTWWGLTVRAGKTLQKMSNFMQVAFVNLQL